MTDDAPPPGDAAEQRLHRDWLTVWQSETAAMATDRELAEQFSAVATLWNRAVAAMLPAKAAVVADGVAPSADATARAAPADAASDARDDEIRQLREYVGDLERRLARPKRAPRKRK